MLFSYSKWLKTKFHYIKICLECPFFIERCSRSLGHCHESHLYRHHVSRSEVYLDPLGPQLVQPIKFIEHFSFLSNLNEVQVVRLLHVFFQGDFAAKKPSGESSIFYVITNNKKSKEKSSPLLLTYILGLKPTEEKLQITLYP